MLINLVYLNMNTMQTFDINYQGAQIRVAPRKVGIDTVFVVQLPAPRKPLVLTKALKQGGHGFWTTIPEEKIRVKWDAALKEAAAIGTLISEHYQLAVKS